MSIQLSKENMLKGMNDMNAFGSRLTGSKGHHEFVEYLKTQVRAIGYEPVSDVKTFERWEEKESRLVLHTKKGDVEVPVASAFPYSGETGPEGITAKTGKITKLRPLKKIVVMRMPDFSRIPAAVAFSERRAMPADLHVTKFYKGPVAVAFIKATVGIFLAKFTGAKAAVFIWQKMSKEMVQGQYLNFILGHLGIPTLWVDEEAGKALLKARKKKTKATLTLDAEIEKNATAESFYVIVPGKNHKENIIINTHTDGVNAVEENGPIAMLEMLRYYKTHQPERDLIFAFVAGHFRLPAFEHKNSIAPVQQATSGWLNDHRDLWDGKRRHPYTVAALALEHFGCEEWKDVDGVYQKTNDVDIELTYTGNQVMDDILYRALEEERSKVRTVSLHPHNFMHFGEGQSTFNVGIPDISLCVAPDYLTVVSEGQEMEKFDLDLMEEQVRAFIRMEQLINEKSAKELGHADFYSFGYGKTHK